MTSGLLLLCVGFGFGAQVTPAYARDFSYLMWKNDSTNTQSARSEAQNSQTISLLESATNIDPKKAIGGGDITIVNDSALVPEDGPSGTIMDIQANDAQGGAITLYTVRANDTVSQIAKMFEVSPNTILWANGLSAGASLHEGEILTILPIDGIRHVVVKGETIQGLAKKYGGSVADILDFNDLTPGSPISIGEVIVIPNGTESVVIPSSSGTTSLSKADLLLNRMRARLIATYPSYSGYYSNPLPEGHKTQGIHGYNGVDLGAPKGSSVYAAAEGVVSASHFRAGDPWFGGYGNYIDIDHPNGTQTRYAHLSAVRVQVGQHVDQGQLIGLVGNTGDSTGPHLHFEVHGAQNPF